MKTERRLALTVIAAIEHEGKVYMGGDGYCSSGVVLDICDTPKVFQIGSVGVGICGNIKCEQALIRVLKRELKNPKKKINRQWIEEKLTELVRRELIKVGAVEPGGGVMPDNSNFLIAFQGQLYLFEEDFSIWRSKRGYQAIGAGTPFAKGALEVLLKDKIPPEKKILRALEAANELCALVLPPFTVIVV